jgi:hypothetical protein
MLLPKIADYQEQEGREEAEETKLSCLLEVPGSSLDHDAAYTYTTIFIFLFCLY